MKPPRFSTATTFLVAIVLAWLEIAPAQAQEWAKARLNNSPRHAEWAEIKSGDRTIKAFVVTRSGRIKDRLCSLFTRFLD